MVTEALGQGVYLDASKELFNPFQDSSLKTALKGLKHF